MLSGKKTATTRTKRHGYPGDSFEAFGKAFALTEVQRIYLDIVARYHYQEEGFSSSHEFVECWNRLHRGVPYTARPMRVVYLHRFTPKQEVAHV